MGVGRAQFDRIGYLAVLGSLRYPLSISSRPLRMLSRMSSDLGIPDDFFARSSLPLVLESKRTGIV